MSGRWSWCPRTWRARCGARPRTRSASGFGWGGPQSPWREVIGVAQDVRDNGVDAAAPAIVYVPARRASAVQPVEALATDESSVRLSRALHAPEVPEQSDVQHHQAGADRSRRPHH